MANLIKNGDFSQQGNEWTATNPENVSYVSGHCIIAAPDSISQEVVTGNGGQFMLFARMKTGLGSAARVEVQPHPTGKPVYLDIGGGQDWTVLSEKFTAQTGTIKFTVKLVANDGVTGTLGSYFGDVTLSRLL
ncbi:hypothetical protein EI534_05475 [Pseudomonas frederiksbergensis]|nr:hypothetical protein [Pseudomonas frederiksbergensis]